MDSNMIKIKNSNRIYKNKIVKYKIFINLNI